jgi:hypothetical protein
LGPVLHVFAWFYVDGAVAPTTGERCFLELPHLTADLFPSFIDALAQALADGLNILLLDHSARKGSRWLENVRYVW